MKKLLAAITLALTFTALVPSTQAGFSMVPANSDARRQFNYEIAAGEEKKDAIVIENNNEKPLTLLLYGADSTHSNQGSFALVNRTATQRTVGNWIKFKESTVTLEGGEKKEIPFTISLPDKVTPGNYAGGIAAETTTIQESGKNNGNANTGAGVVISSRLVVKLFVSVPGEKTVKYDWTEFTHMVTANGKQRCTFSFKNDGNAAIVVEPKIEMKNMFWGEPEEFKIPGTTLLQNEKVTIPFDWDKKPRFGFFTAKATTVFSEYDIANNQNINPKTITKTLTFWIVPWDIVAIAIAVLSLILIVVVYKTVIMRKLKKSAKAYEVQEGETLVSIAEKSKVSWKKLAKLNKMKPPYTVKKGDKLQVPSKK